VALIIGTRMTRTVTGAVAQLYDATKNVDRGDFGHRIPVKSADQLAQLSLSFNSMTESIEKLILEQKEKQRLEGELAIAQEVQGATFSAAGIGTGVARSAWLLPSGAHRERGLLRLSHRQFPQVDSGGRRYQRKRNFGRALDGDHPLGGGAPTAWESLPQDAGAGGGGRRGWRGQNHGCLARGHRGFSRSIAWPAQSSALRKHASGKILPRCFWALRRPLASN